MLDIELSYCLIETHRVKCFYKQMKDSDRTSEKGFECNKKFRNDFGKDSERMRQRLLKLSVSTLVILLRRLPIYKFHGFD